MHYVWDKKMMWTCLAEVCTNSTTHSLRTAKNQAHFDGTEYQTVCFTGNSLRWMPGVLWLGTMALLSLWWRTPSRSSVRPSHLVVWINQKTHLKYHEEAWPRRTGEAEKCLQTHLGHWRVPRKQRSGQAKTTEKQTHTGEPEQMLEEKWKERESCSIKLQTALWCPFKRRF